MERYAMLLLLGAVVLLLCTGNTLAIEGARGATWGELRWDIPKEGDDIVFLQGWIKQGIDWKRWENNASLNTYVAFRYKLDSEKYSWNNSLAPTVGISLDLFSERGISATWGVEYLWDYYTVTDNWDQKWVIYMGWYGWWDLAGR